MNMRHDIQYLMNNTKLNYLYLRDHVRAGFLLAHASRWMKQDGRF